MTMERFKQRFTKTDLDSRLESIELRQTRDKLAEQKRDKERQQHEQERQQKAEQDRVNREKRQQERAEREKRAELEQERQRQEQLSEARWDRVYKWTILIGAPIIIIGAIFVAWTQWIH